MCSNHERGGQVSSVRRATVGEAVPVRRADDLPTVHPGGQRVGSPSSVGRVLRSSCVQHAGVPEHRPRLRGPGAEVAGPRPGVIPEDDAMSDNEEADRPNPAEALEQLGRLALREHTMQSLLQSVADLTKKVMPGNPEASVSLLINDKPSTAVSTGRLATDCDESQYGLGYGPCLHAAST